MVRTWIREFLFSFVVVVLIGAVAAMSLDMTPDGREIGTVIRGPSATGIAGMQPLRVESPERAGDLAAMHPAAMSGACCACDFARLCQGADTQIAVSLLEAGGNAALFAPYASQPPHAPPRS